MATLPVDRKTFKQLIFGVKLKKPNSGEDKADAFNAGSKTSLLQMQKLPEEVRKKRARASTGDLNVVETYVSDENAIEPTRKAQKKRKKPEFEGGIELLAGAKLVFERPSKKALREEKRQQKSPGEELSKGNAKHLELTDQEVNQVRKLNRIFTWGVDIPAPIISFCDLKLPSRLLETLIKAGFQEPTPVQMQAIPIALQKRDLLVTAPTGSGKTLSFAIPLIFHALDQKQRSQKSFLLSAIVLSPTKVLAKQTFDAFSNFCEGMAIKSALLEKQTIIDECHILVTTPNKLLLFLDSMEPERREQLLDGLRWLVVDECDRFFDRTEGEQSFRVQLDRLWEVIGERALLCRALFSATFSYEVEEWCRAELRNKPATLCIGPRNSANTSVHQELVFAGWEQAKISVMKDLVRRGFDPPALVFVQSKDRAQQLFQELRTHFPTMSVCLVSGDIPTADCVAMLAKFRSGCVQILVCTELIGRGLDFPDVGLVVNFDLPTSIVSYIHRIGRTGRAGRQGRALTLFTKADFEIIRPIATVIQQSGFSVPEYLLRLNKLSKKDKKQLKRKAPHRKNLVFRWGRVKKNQDAIERRNKFEHRKNKRRRNGPAQQKSATVADEADSK